MTCTYRLHMMDGSLVDLPRITDIIPFVRTIYFMRGTEEIADIRINEINYIEVIAASNEEVDYND